MQLCTEQNQNNSIYLHRTQTLIIIVYASHCAAASGRERSGVKDKKAQLSEIRYGERNLQHSI